MTTPSPEPDPEPDPESDPVSDPESDPGAASGAGRLAGRVALITGASRGIGAAIARRYAAEGAHPVLVARGQGGLEALDDAIRAAGGEATLVPLDLAESDAAPRLAAALHERFGRLDILVGNAGQLIHFGPIAQFDWTVWNRVMDANVTANFQLIRHLHPLLGLSEAGRAIFTTSGLARRVLPHAGAYAVSKAALEMMVQLYAAEVERQGLKVNLVDPGQVATRLHAEAFPGEDQSALPEPDSVAGLYVTLGAADCPHHGEILRA